MHAHVLTIPFDPDRGLFDDEDLTRFLLDKRVTTLEPAFFSAGGRPFWSVFVAYELVLSGEPPPPEDDLDPRRQLLLQRLREWRKERAGRDGVPSYIIAITKDRLPLLDAINLLLEKQRVLFRLAHDRRYIPVRQYAYISEAIDEAGRMTGGRLIHPAWCRGSASAPRGLAALPRESGVGHAGSLP